MTSPALWKRLEALESASTPSKPIILWRPYQPNLAQQEAFDAEVATRQAASPRRQVITIGWNDAA
jgi:hypothetical protein